MNIMKWWFILAVCMLLGCKQNTKKEIKSNKKSIHVSINGRQINWRISPQENPDKLRVYCSKEKNEVKFLTDIDSASYFLSENDTIKFDILLNSKDTVKTAIIGIKNIPNTISMSEKLYWYGQIWSEAKYNFVNVDKLKFNLDSLYQALLPSILQSENDYEYYRILQRFYATLNDGHTLVSPGNQFLPLMDYIPVTLRDFNKKVYITRVRKKPELDSTWVGAEIIKIKGIPTKDFFEQKIFPYISASTEQHKWMQAIYKIQSGFKTQPFVGTIQKKDGCIQEIEITRNGEETRTSSDEYWGSYPNFSRKIVDLKWISNQIAQLSFNRFSPTKKAIKEFYKATKQLKRAKGIIIDLRRNGGGSTTVANFLQQYLTKDDYFLNYSWETRINDGVKKANGNWIEEYKDYFNNKAYRFESHDTIRVADTISRFNCPIVILIGRYTFSAAEDFLVNLFEHYDRPLLIGEETGGSTGSPLVIQNLPNGGYAKVCTRRICYPQSQKRFVNSGVKPDIEVRQTITDYLTGKDIVLQKAVEIIKKRKYFINK